MTTTITGVISAFSEERDLSESERITIALALLRSHIREIVEEVDHQRDRPWWKRPPPPGEPWSDA